MWMMLYYIAIKLPSTVTMVLEMKQLLALPLKAVAVGHSYVCVCYTHYSYNSAISYYIDCHSCV